MKRIVAGFALALVLAAPVSAAGSIAVNEPGPYAHGDTITLTVVVPKLKGYEYPVVLITCRDDADRKMWVYFRRWDDEGYDYPRSSGPEPVLLGGSPTAGNLWNQEGGDVTCSVELHAYAGLTGRSPRFIANDDAIFVTRPEV